MTTENITRPSAGLDRRHLVLGLSGVAIAATTPAAAAKPQHDRSKTGSGYPVTYHRTKTIDGINIFYREAGPRDAPVVLLLHGFPTSSHMFRNLIPALADRYHVIAPDYPGYGQSDMPPRASFKYTFDRFGELVDGLLDQLGVKRYAMYVMDYGAPVGWRLAAGAQTSRAHQRPHRSERQRLRRRTEGVLESDQEILDRRVRQQPSGADEAADPGDDQIPVHRRHVRREPHLARQLGP
nr:alpha/beta fold hydrolase [Bradyrhizobium sp. 191]